MPQGVSVLMVHRDCDLIPDMTASAQAILDGFVWSYRYFVCEQCYTKYWLGSIGDTWYQHMLLWYCARSLFNSSLSEWPTTQTISGANNFLKQMVITTYNRPAGTMTYHPQHGHIHLDGWAEYTLRQPMIGKQPYEWPVVGTGNKQSYCLVNLGQCTDGNGYCRYHRQYFRTR